MSTIYLMIPVTLLIAGGFLVAYVWSVRNGQFEDTTTPAMRMLSDDKPFAGSKHNANPDASDNRMTLPHPSPLPQEEGESSAASLKCPRLDSREAPANDPARRNLFPLPAGEGQGEGESAFITVPSVNP